jgi:hypothetical protein
MADTGRPYFAYLLRAWRAGGENDGPWRAMLEDAQTEERFTFSEFEDLLAFLREQAGDGPVAGPEPGQGRGSTAVEQ